MRSLTLGLALALGACSSPNTSSPDPEPEKVVEDSVDPEPEYNPTELDQYTSDLDGDDLRATISTSLGDLDCDLFEAKAPRTVTNFVGLARGMKPWVDPETEQSVQKPLYDGLPFHRIMPGYFAQTGDPSGTGNGGPGFTFPDELSDELKHDRPGVMSMAHRGANTNGSQFFILLKPTPHLDGHHSIFGHCDGDATLKKLDAVPTDSSNQPVSAPVLQRVTIYKQ